MKLWQKEVLGVLFISSIPVLLSLTRYYGFGLTWHGTEVQPRPITFVYGALYSLAVTSSLYFGCTRIIQFIDRKMPWREGVVRRLAVELLVVFFYASVAQYFIIMGFSKTPLYEGIAVTKADLFDNIIFGNTITLIVVLLMEGVFFFQQWRKSVLETEQLKRQQVESQYESLKSQLDPHFLFNSLNVLSSLIRKDPKKAEQFVDEFARIYRYVLDVKDEMVVPLREELRFLDSFMFLQQIRFGSALELKENISAAHLELYVPPLSLQELVSNAIKHNEVSAERPLVITLESTSDGIRISNNLQRRTDRVISTGLGLQNLRERYRILTSHEPDFRILEGTYRADLPLIQAEA
ncbi:histidine kinase [Cryomorphaceae bacterium]|nr:histidine kinase [Cryomorphaceae bacterium]